MFHLIFIFQILGVFSQNSSSNLIPDTPPYFASIESASKYIKEGDFFILPCTTSKNNSKNYKWLHDGNIIKSQKYKTIKFNSFNEHDSGKYSCVIENSYGSVRSIQHRLNIGKFEAPNFEKSRVIVNVDYGKAVHFNVKYANESFHRIEYMDGDAFIEIFVKSQPLASVTWLRDNLRVSSSRFIHKSSLDGSLTIFNFDSQTRIKGNLINGFEDAVEGYFTPMFTLNPKKLSNHDHYLTMVSGLRNTSVTLFPQLSSETKFECLFNAKPYESLRLRWYLLNKDSHNPQANRDAWILIDNRLEDDGFVYHHDKRDHYRSLTVSNLRLKSVDNVNFHLPTSRIIICEAQLENGILGQPKRLHSSARLTFNTKPIISHGPMERSVLFEKIHRDAYVRKAGVDQLIELPCGSSIIISDGLDNQPNVTWFINSELFLPKVYNQRIRVHPNGSLIIDKTSIYDEAIYQCVLSNMSGDEDIITFWLHLQNYRPVIARQFRDYFPHGNAQKFHLEANKPVIINCPLTGNPRSKNSWSFEEKKGQQRRPLLPLVDDSTRNNNDYNRLTIPGRQGIFMNNPTGYFLFGSIAKQMNLDNPDSTTLQIINLDKNLSGIMLYCEQQNEYGRNEIALEVISLTAPIVEILEETNELYVVEKGVLRISCKFTYDNDDEIEVLWAYRNFQGDVNNQSIFDINEDTLITTNATSGLSQFSLTDISKSNSDGIFSCIVKSRLGEYKDSISVKVISKCGTPTILNVTIEQQLKDETTTSNNWLSVTLTWSENLIEFQTRNKFNIFYSSLDNSSNAWRRISSINSEQYTCSMLKNKPDQVKDVQSVCRTTFILSGDLIQNAFLLSLDCENSVGSSEKTMPYKVTLNENVRISGLGMDDEYNIESGRNEGMLMMTRDQLKAEREYFASQEILGNLDFLSASNVKFSWKPITHTMRRSFFYHVSLISLESSTGKPIKIELIKSQPKIGPLDQGLNHTRLVGDLKPATLYQLSISYSINGFIIEKEGRFVKIFRTLEDANPKIEDYRVILESGNVFEINWTLDLIKSDNQVLYYQLTLVHLLSFNGPNGTHESSIIKEEELIEFKTSLTTYRIQPKKRKRNENVNLNDQELSYNISLRVQTLYGWSNCVSQLWMPTWTKEITPRRDIFKLDQEIVLVNENPGKDLRVRIHYTCFECQKYLSINMGNQFIWKTEDERNTLFYRIPIIFHFNCLPEILINNEPMEIENIINNYEITKSEVSNGVNHMTKLTIDYFLVVEEFVNKHNCESWFLKPTLANTITREEKSPTLALNYPQARQSLQDMIALPIDERKIKIFSPLRHEHNYARIDEDQEKLPSFRYNKRILNITSIDHTGIVRTLDHNIGPIELLSRNNRWSPIEPFMPIGIDHEMELLAFKSEWKFNDNSLTLSILWNNTIEFPQIIRIYQIKYILIHIDLSIDNKILKRTLFQVPVTTEYGDLNFSLNPNDLRIIKSYLCNPKSLNDSTNISWNLSLSLKNEFTTSQKTTKSYPLPNFERLLTGNHLTLSVKDEKMIIDFDKVPRDGSVIYRITELDYYSGLERSLIGDEMKWSENAKILTLPSGLYRVDILRQTQNICRDYISKDTVSVHDWHNGDHLLKRIVDKITPRKIKILDGISQSNDLDFSSGSITLVGNTLSVDGLDDNLSSFKIVEIMSHLKRFTVEMKADQDFNWIKFPIEFSIIDINQFTITNLKRGSVYRFRLSFITIEGYKTAFSPPSDPFLIPLGKDDFSVRNLSVNLMIDDKTGYDIVEVTWIGKAGHEYLVTVKNLCSFNETTVNSLCENAMPEPVFTYRITMDGDRTQVKTSFLRLSHLQPFQYYLVSVRLSDRIHFSLQNKVIFSGRSNALAMSSEYSLETNDNDDYVSTSIKEYNYGMTNKTTLDMLTGFRCITQRNLGDIVLTCKWSINNKLKDVHFLGYNIKLSTTDQRANGKTETKYKSFLVSRDTTRIVLRNSQHKRYLEPYTNYLITINPVTINSCQDHIIQTNIATPQLAPMEPTYLVASWRERNTAVILWKPPLTINGIIMNYLVEILEDGQSHGSHILASTIQNYTQENLKANVKYTILVSARTQSQEWGPSAQLDIVSFDQYYPETIAISGGICRLPKIQQISIYSPFSSVNNNHKQISPSNIQTKPSSIVDAHDFVLMSLPGSGLHTDLTNKRSSSPNNNNMLQIKWKNVNLAKESVTGYLVEFRTSVKINKWKRLYISNSNKSEISLNLSDDNGPESFHSIFSSISDDATSQDFSSEREILLERFRRLSNLNHLVEDSMSIVSAQFRISPFNERFMGEPSKPTDWIFIVFPRITETILQKWWFLVLVTLLMTSLMLGLFTIFCFVIRKRGLKKYPHLTIEKKIGQQIFTNNLSAVYSMKENNSIDEHLLKHNLSQWLSNNDSNNSIINNNNNPIYPISNYNNSSTTLTRRKDAIHLNIDQQAYFPNTTGNNNENSYIDLVNMPNGQDFCFTPIKHPMNSNASCCNSPVIYPNQTLISGSRLLSSNLQLDHTGLFSTINRNINGGPILNATPLQKPQQLIDAVEDNYRVESIASTSNSSVCTPNKMESLKDNLYLENYQFNDPDVNDHSPNLGTNSLFNYSAGTSKNEKSTVFKVPSFSLLNNGVHQYPQNLSYLPPPNFSPNDDSSLRKMRSILKNPINLESTLL